MDSNHTPKRVFLALRYTPFEMRTNRPAFSKCTRLIFLRTAFNQLRTASEDDICKAIEEIGFSCVRE